MVFFPRNSKILLTPKLNKQNSPVYVNSCVIKMPKCQSPHFLFRTNYKPICMLLGKKNQKNCLYCIDSEGQWDTNLSNKEISRTDLKGTLNWIPWIHYVKGAFLNHKAFRGKPDPRDPTMQK